MKALHLVITDFNGFQQTGRCLEALRSSRFQDFTALVVDHGTTDETRRGLASEYREVIRIKGSADLWWTGATNLGVREALTRGADAVMLLNNDCYVTPDTIGTLVALAHERPDAIVAPVQRNLPSGKINTISPRSRFGLGFPTVPGPRDLTPEASQGGLLPVQLIAGGRGVIIPAGAFAEIGLFDEEQLPHYWADHDFYLAARRRGIPLYVATQAFVDVDNTRTTMADRPETLSFSEFLDTLTNTRSHRNLRDITALFRKHYPIRQLYMVGVLLYLSRYMLVYLACRSRYRVRRLLRD
jgi:GT2 family glycosyltransferase